MISILFEPSSVHDDLQVDWWIAWQKRAETATEKIVASFEQWLEVDQPAGKSCRLNFDSAVWKELKDWYLKNIFYKKCAYCEREISGYYGDAEHYRPKGAVRCERQPGNIERATCELPDPNLPGNVVRVDHPGYFWLAYDWRNLLPSCVYCNSGHGKNDRFDAKQYVVMMKLEEADVNALPVHERPRRSKKWPNYYYPTPATLDSFEQPRLLNPLNAVDTRNPRTHIRFGVRGLVAAVDNSDRGGATIALLQLRDEELRQERQMAQEAFADRFYDAMRRFDPQKPKESEAAKLLDKYTQGRYPFSAAALDYHTIVAKAQTMLMGSEPSPL